MGQTPAGNNAAAEVDVQLGDVEPGFEEARSLRTALTFDLLTDRHNLEEPGAVACTVVWVGATSWGPPRTTGASARASRR